MAFYDLLHKFNYIEFNNLKALQPGFVVAQMEVAEDAESDLCVEVNGRKFIENGTICTISKDGVCAWEEGKPMFIVYNDPLNTVRNGDEYYATEIKNENPRCVLLIPGDEFMANGEAADHKGLEAAIAAGMIVEVTKDDGQSKDDWFGMNEMPNGDAGKHYLFIGK
jgi:hypothetical protein